MNDMCSNVTSLAQRKNTTSKNKYFNSLTTTQDKQLEKNTI